MMDFVSYLTESKSFLAPVNNSNLINLSSVKETFFPSYFIISSIVAE